MSKQEQQQAVDYLHENIDGAITDGDQRPRLYFIIRGVARSGMSRTMSVYVNDGANMLSLTYNIAKACGFPLTADRDAFRVSGCGMDMRFHVADVLAHRLGMSDGNAFDIRSL